MEQSPAMQQLRLTAEATWLCSAATPAASDLVRAGSSVVEHSTFNRMVEGSTPSRHTIPNF
jgi:hypothetical protein